MHFELSCCLGGIGILVASILCLAWGSSVRNKVTYCTVCDMTAGKSTPQSSTVISYMAHIIAKSVRLMVLKNDLQSFWREKT